jgi:uncharacterized membrane protein YoaK (UPF0700 family)
VEEEVSTEDSLPSIREPLPRTLLGLTFVTGLVDAISFLGLGQVFAGMMTGNVLFLGFGIAGTAGSSLLAPVIALGAFVCGGTIGGLVAARSPERPDRGLIAGIALEVALLAGATAVALAVDVRLDDPAAWVLIGILSFAMGARNTIVRRIGVAELPTMVVTMAVASFRAGTSFAGASPAHLVPRAATVIAMLSGAVAGALLLDEAGLSVSLAAGAAVTLVSGGSFALAGRRSDSSRPDNRDARTAAGSR